MTTDPVLDHVGHLRARISKLAHELYLERERCRYERDRRKDAEKLANNLHARLLAERIGRLPDRDDSGV